MPTDEDDQDGHFFYINPERGATSLPRRAKPLLLLFRSTGGGGVKTAVVDAGRGGGSVLALALGKPLVIGDVP